MGFTLKDIIVTLVLHACCLDLYRSIWGQRGDFYNVKKIPQPHVGAASAAPPHLLADNPSLSTDSMQGLLQQVKCSRGRNLQQTLEDATFPSSVLHYGEHRLQPSNAMAECFTAAGGWGEARACFAKISFFFLACRKVTREIIYITSKTT